MYCLHTIGMSIINGVVGVCYSGVSIVLKSMVGTFIRIVRVPTVEGCSLSGVPLISMVLGLQDTVFQWYNVHRRRYIIMHYKHACMYVSCSILTVPHLISEGTPFSCSLGCFRNTFSGSFQLKRHAGEETMHIQVKGWIHVTIQ